jgi:hypothetical protein
MTETDHDANQTNPPAETDPPATEPRKRKGLPTWGVVAFLVLLGGMVMVNQWVSSSGPEIRWENDLDAALAKTSDEQPRVFLYFYDPSDASHERNELRVFSQRWARESLVDTVCCRIALGDGDLKKARLARDYGYEGRPLFLLLTRDGTPVGRTEGEVDEREFMTYIGMPAQKAAREAQEPEDDS